MRGYLIRKIQHWTKNTSPHYNLTRSEPNRKPDRHGANQINPIDNPGTLQRMTQKSVANTIKGQTHI